MVKFTYKPNLLGIPIRSVQECCGEAVDQYVEYDIVLIVIHLVLLYLPAYTHIVHNTRYKVYPRLAFLFILCMTFDRWYQRERSGLESILDLEYGFYECFFLSIFQMGLFLIFSLLVAHFSSFNKEQLILTANSVILGYFGSVATVVCIVYGVRDTLYYRILMLVFLYPSSLLVHFFSLHP
ncbi:hypothetical protein PRIPAC_89970 [Pristionchus pacificus]|nr:hypothetical protein PRIPAC_89970 [Pristionchus pacificus]